jgi:hypothetical protein
MPISRNSAMRRLHMPSCNKSIEIDGTDEVQAQLATIGLPAAWKRRRRRLPFVR